MKLIIASDRSKINEPIITMRNFFYRSYRCGDDTSTGLTVFPTSEDAFSKAKDNTRRLWNLNQATWLTDYLLWATTN